DADGFEVAGGGHEGDELVDERLGIGALRRLEARLAEPVAVQRDDGDARRAQIDADDRQSSITVPAGPRLRTRLGPTRDSSPPATRGTPRAAPRRSRCCRAPARSASR